MSKVPAASSAATPALSSAPLHDLALGSTAPKAQLFFDVWVMKVPSCGVTFVLLQVGHLTLAFSLSEMVMVSSNSFWHFSHCRLPAPRRRGRACPRSSRRRLGRALVFSLHRLEASLHLLGRDVLLMRRHQPVVAERVLDGSEAVAPEHVLRGHL